jgi:hypothetical protein
VYVMTGAVIVSAAALIFQAALLLGMYKASKDIRTQVTTIAGHTDSFVQSAQLSLEQSRKQISAVATKSSEVLDLAHRQLVRVDGVLGEATGRARIQMERVDLVLDDAVGRMSEALTLLNNGVIRPVREVTAVAAGIEAGLRYLFRSQRRTVERATSDEEMFI